MPVVASYATHPSANVCPSIGRCSIRYVPPFRRGTSTHVAPNAMWCVVMHS